MLSVAKGPTKKAPTGKSSKLAARSAARKPAPATLKSSAKSAVKPRLIPAAKSAAPVKASLLAKAAKPVVVESKDVSGKVAKPLSSPKNHAAPAPQVPLPPAPVSSDGKPRKNQAGMTPRELEGFRDLLLAKRRELVGDMSSMEREALRSAQGSNLSNLPIHMADMGTDNYEQEFTLGLVEKDRQLLREINVALAKIINGTYGICEGTGKPISKARLEAQPWAKYSIEHARELEKGGVRR
jgi:RNA polymerase-binding protein DksA